ncbi:phosphonopyruvate decarboxylase [Methanocorpusculum vombati]|uniref:sulfopyruvate decarboxylase n=1 Tax=Methanocorpusculum vombati TaxID=3002864 RepID=A0ABT4IJS3_9EURY|nr:phosphonopyruvate decarboxylase [Methanocorpusculum vombati]MCZ9320197.1 phosphonopyruvate decarboxylase [Methanocorpusculum sp.]MCZ0861984.1 phosphonopyruvate decarboxylase [Methanocorpusculum vombati]MDE2520104.1 phosphonopyruvate decarboxylase [Methanocorpusculum sp.]MDE2535229.1 phosphonopyruvate decarboxylase [Methanocorpusculum sp.]MDE2546895.1 phosphonopyruvate decarboxylase [Methanocorpusculum sp.]
MKIQLFIQCLRDTLQISSFTGIPDSQLSSLCNYLVNTHGISSTHIIPANEGNAVALAAGYHLATGKTPCVYLQNSGEGNIINPVTSLLHPEVYGIPCLFIIGWRGEPDVHDEPQHSFQGKITLEILDTLQIPYLVIDKDTNPEILQQIAEKFSETLSKGNSVAFVIKKGALTYDQPVMYQNSNSLLREDIIKEITNVSGDDVIISTTGKTSRELFEIRETVKASHKSDFLTVGSMGHSSSIALGIALNKPATRVWCIDGDGAVLMHMGSMAIIGSQNPKNLIHVVVNNAAHESVGGMPTVSANIDLPAIAKGCGYKNVCSVDTREELIHVLAAVKTTWELTFIEINAKIGSRPTLGRPTLTPHQNKENFMQYLAGLR